MPLKLETIRFIRTATPRDMEEVLMTLIAKEPDLAALVISDYENQGGTPVTFGCTTFNVKPKELAELNEISLVGGRKISVIKRIREMWGLGLREAKEYCEFLASQGKINRDCDLSLGR